MLEYDTDIIVQHLDLFASDLCPASIISDFHLLGGSTGVEAVTSSRKDIGKNVPALIVSGDTSKVVQDASSLENSEIMSKPVNTTRLLESARTAIVKGIVPPE